MASLTNLIIAMATRKTNSFEFKYEGDFQSLDALTVLHSQINFVQVLKEIKDHQFPEVKLDVKIKGVEPGSLDINHIIEVGAITGMFVMENYKYVTTIFKLFGDIIKLKKFLRGEKAESTKSISQDKIEVHLHGDNIQVHPDAFKIYQKSPVITGALNNTSKLLSAEDKVDFVEVTDKSSKKKVIKIEKKDFESLAEDNPYLLHRTDEQTYLGQILFIKKPNLFPDKKRKWIWELIHQGRDIKASIVDPAFMQKINDGFKVGQGDRLRADLKIFYRFDERFNTYMESQRYEVSGITDIIERTSESKFDF
jgi:hypothetical protein